MSSTSVQQRKTIDVSRVQKLCTTHQQTIFLKQGNIPGQTILYLPLIAMLGIPTRPMMVLDANKGTRDGKKDV